MTEDDIDEMREGSVYEDSVFGNELQVKYCDDRVVLVQDLESEHHHLYPRKQFDQNSKRTLIQTENRFKLQNVNE